MSDAAASPSPAKKDLPPCDIVMKGGITSGIVYPPAIIELASKYRFSSIGGTSAGGIVAALTAAAEYGRQTTVDDAFTGRMRTIAGELQTPGMVKNLFKPVPKLHAPFNIFLSAMKGSSLRSKALHVLPCMIVYTPVGFFVGVLFGLAVWRGIADGLLYLTSYLGQSVHAQVPGWLQLSLHILGYIVFGLFNGVLGSAVSLLWQTFGRLPEEKFGICSGFSTIEDAAAGSARSTASSTPGAEGKRKSATTILTNWLHENINYLAGRSYSSAPVTIAELDRVGISLRMMTSNLSQGQPYVVPFRQNIFLFKKEEMDKLFPAVVVKHLVDHSHKSDRIKPPDGYYFLPEASDFPLIVAARLSLSFPVLISALPLYTIKQSAFREKVDIASPKPLEESDVDRNLFSDGGISSNFPIQFFDAWFPTNPTFGINLTSWSEDAFQRPGPDQSIDTDRLKTDHFGATAQDIHPALQREGVVNAVDPEQAVYLPRANTNTPLVVQPIGDVGAFLGAIFNVAQNFRDNTQSHLPSYRERIVQVRLADNEGGLNLDMPKELIGQMMEKGRRAGEILTQDFNFEQHQWVRLLVLMQQLEYQLQFLEKSLTKDEYKKLTDAMLHAAPPYPYHRDQAWLDNANAAMPALFDLMQAWKGKNRFNQKHPHPEAVLRVTPDFDVYPLDKSTTDND